MSKQADDPITRLHVNKLFDVDVTGREAIPDGGKLPSGIDWMFALYQAANIDVGQEGEPSRYYCLGQLRSLIPSGSDYDVTDILRGDITGVDVHKDIVWMITAQEEARRMGCTLRIEGSTVPFTLWAEWPVKSFIMLDGFTVAVPIEESHSRPLTAEYMLQFSRDTPPDGEDGPQGEDGPTGDVYQAEEWPY